MSEDQFLLFGEIWRKYGGRDEAGADLAFQLRNGDFVTVAITMRQIRENSIAQAT